MYGPTPSEATHSASALGMPVNAIHELRKAAPARMNRIMQDRRVAPIRLGPKVAGLRGPLPQAIANAPRKPKAAASVAVGPPADNAAHTKNSQRSQGRGVRARRHPPPR